MLCTFCGSASGNAGFCTSCGKALAIPPPSPKMPETPPSGTTTGTASPVPHAANVAPPTAPPLSATPTQTPRTRDPRKRRGWVPVLVVSLVALVLVGGSGAALWWLYSDIDSGTSKPSPSETRASPGNYGSDPELDALWDECAEGTFQSCDDLYLTAAEGSDYEQFGATCGNRGDGYGSCAILGGISEPAADGAFGSDLALDLLWTECESGSMTACDDLYLGSPVGSEYEEFGATCGARGDATGECVFRFP